MSGVLERITGLLRRGAASQTVGNTLWLGGSSAFNGLIGAVIAAILARSLGVEEYGIYTLIISLLVLLTDVADLGVSSSIIRFGSESLAEGNRQKLKAVIAIVLRWKLIIGAIVVTGSLLFLDQIVGIVFQHVDDRIASYFRLSLIGVGVGIAAGMFAPVYQSFKQFRTYAFIFSSRALAKLAMIALLVFVFVPVSVPALIWIEIASIFLFLVLLYSFSPFREFSYGTKDKELEKKMFSFNKWISLYQAIALVGARLDLAFVGGLSDAYELGLYGAASKVSGLILVGASSYMTVLLPEMSSALTPESLKRKQRNSVVVVGLISAGLVMVALAADVIVHVFFGEAFAAAASVLRILCAGIFFTVLAYPVNASLFAMNKTAAYPVMSVISLAAFVGANIILVPRFGAEGAAMAFAINALTGLVVSVAFYAWFRRVEREG